MDDFDYIRVDDDKSFVKVWNKISRAVALKVDITTQHNIQGFLYLYHDQRKMGIDTGGSRF